MTARIMGCRTEWTGPLFVWRVALTIQIVWISGCGGTTQVPPVQATRDPAVVSNVEVNEEAMNQWNTANDAFAREAAAGWGRANCQQVDRLYEEANAAQGHAFTESIYMRGVVARECGDIGSATSFFLKALEVNSGFCKARAAIGLIRLDEGDEVEALSAFNKALEDDPRCTEAYLNRSIVSWRRGAPAQEVLNDIRRALAIESDFLPAFNQMALLYFRMARDEGDDRRLDLAEVVCRQAQLLDRDYAPIYNTWGLIKIERNDVIEALRMFERAKQLDNDMFEAFMNFGQMTLSFRGYADARQSFARAVELQPESYDAIIGLGAAYRGERNYQDAQRQYERAIELDASRPEAYFNLGLLWQDYMSGSIEDLNRAMEFYEQFLAKSQGQDSFASAVEAVNRNCTQARGRRRSSDCRPGRLQLIRDTVSVLEEVQSLQREAERRQSEADQ
ncbi:MAG: tetratricopeptide repeat protein [Myxococcota bacterium]